MTVIVIHRKTSSRNLKLNFILTQCGKFDKIQSYSNVLRSAKFKAVLMCYIPQNSKLSQCATFRKIQTHPNVPTNSTP